MGQARRRQAEIMALKAAGNNGKNIGIHFTFDLYDHKYELLAVYEPKILDQVRDNDYDNDKCFDIILEQSQNLLAVKNGAAISDPRASSAVQTSMKNVALAVMRHAVLDPYKSVGLVPNMVLSMSLGQDDDGNIGYNLLGDGQSLFSAQKGLQKRIDSAQADGIDFVVVVG